MRLAASNDLLSIASLDLVSARLTPAVNAVRDKSSVLFDLLETLLQGSNESVLRLTDDFAAHPVWKGGLRIALEDTVATMRLMDRVRDQIGVRYPSE